MRPATYADEPFLRAVFDASRGPLFAALPAHQRGHLLDLQWVAQRRSFAIDHPAAVDHVIDVAGVPAGRLLLARCPDRVDILDIALLPDHRGRGIGTSVLRTVLDEAAAAGQSVHLHVARDNEGAIRLYRRLGFTPSGPGTATHVALVHEGA